MSRRYSEEFKLKAIELSYVNGSIKETCEDLGVPISVLSRWRREQKQYGKNSFPGKGYPKQTDAEKEIAKLKKQLQDSKLENEILKKAIYIFSKSDRKNTGL